MEGGEVPKVGICIIGDEQTSFWQAFNKLHTKFSIFVEDNPENILSRQVDLSVYKILVVADSYHYDLIQVARCLRNKIQTLGIILIIYSVDENCIELCKEEGITEIGVVKGGGTKSAPHNLFSTIEGCLQKLNSVAS